MKRRAGLAIIAALALGAIPATAPAAAQTKPRIDIDDVPTRTSKARIKAVRGQVVVGFKRTPGKLEAKALKRLGLEGVSYSRAGKFGLFSVRDVAKGKATLSEVMGLVTDASTNISFVEPNVLGKMATTPTNPNDPLFPNQWYLRKIQVPEAYTATNAFAQPGSGTARNADGRQFFQSGLQQAQASEAAAGSLHKSMFNLEPGDPGCEQDAKCREQAAALAQTNVDYGPLVHPSAYCGENDVNNERYQTGTHYCINQWTKDWQILPLGTAPPVTPAATHAARIVGLSVGRTNDGTGMAGVCPFCRATVVQFLTAEGAATAVDLANAIDEAIRRKIKVFDIGVAFSNPSTTLQSAAKRAKDAGLFLSCPAGNTGSKAMTYPAAYDGCFAVGATDFNDKRAASSAYGGWVHIQAPGEGLITLNPNNTFSAASGTSTASALVAGAAGMMAVSRRLDAAGIAANLSYAAEPLPTSLRGSNYQSANPESHYGRLNVLRAVGSPEPPVYSDQVVPTDVRNGGFEEITDGQASPWSEHSSGRFPLISNRRPLQGKHSAFLAGYNMADDWIWQDFQTKGTGKITVRFALDSRLAKADSDRLDVNLVKHGGARYTFGLKQLVRDSQGLYRITLDTKDPGKMWRLEFHAVTDGADPALFFVDQVALTQE